MSDTPVNRAIIPTYPDPIKEAEHAAPAPYQAGPASMMPAAPTPGRYQLPEGHAAYARPGETAPRMDVGHLPSIGTGTTLADLMEATESLFRGAREPYHDPMYQVLRPYLIAAKDHLQRVLEADINDFVAEVKLRQIREWLELPALATPLKLIAEESAPHTVGVACTITIASDLGDGTEMAMMRRTEPDGTILRTTIETDDPMIIEMFTVGDTIRLEGVAK